MVHTYKGSVASIHTRSKLSLIISPLRCPHHHHLLLQVFLITELLTGGELLDAVLKRGTYNEAEARLCFVQLLKGIAYLHSRCESVESAALTGEWGGASVRALPWKVMREREASGQYGESI